MIAPLATRLVHGWRMTRLPSVLTPTDLPFAELRAMQLDGLLVAVDDAFATIDAPPSPTQRAGSIAAYCQQRLIAEQHTAAWIWGAIPQPPRRHELCVSIGARARSSAPTLLAVREVVIASNEIVLLGSVRVTTPLRTIMDLARFQDEFEPDLITALLRVSGLTLDYCIAELQARPNLPRKKLALQRLTSLSAGRTPRAPTSLNS